MTNKAECDKYAAELAQRFDELIRWAIINWPNKEFPLLDSDFSASRRELGEILGPKLGDGGTSNAPSSQDKNSGQFIDTKPMPWP